MSPLAIVGLFCEDIREESGDVLTLVGLMPDNITIDPISKPGEKKENVPFHQNKFLAKLCVYARANFDPTDPIKEINLSLVFPDGKRGSIGGASVETIQQSKDQAKAGGLPLAGVIMRAYMAGFRLPGPGILRLEAEIDGQTRLLAMLNFTVNDVKGESEREKSTH